jgi:glycosyltransferase involved in cell wall biosynthesis
VTARRVRIAHVVTRFRQAGSERAVATAIEALGAESYEHELVVGRDHEVDVIAELLGDVPVVVVPQLIRRPDPLRDLRALLALRRVLHDGRFDIVHTLQSKAGILGRAAARLVRVPYCVHTVAMANFGEGYGRASAVYLAAERLASRWTDQYLVFGEDLMGRFVDRRVAPPARFRIIRSEVDIEGIGELARLGRVFARRRLELPLDAPLVLFAASLDERKGAQDLPDFLSCLRARGRDDIVVLVAGEGPLARPLRQELRRRGLKDAVRFLGFTSELIAYQVAADCFLQLSRAEGLSIVSVQAAAARTPIVSYAVDGVQELLRRGAAGAVVPVGDVAAAAAAVGEQLGRARGAEADLNDWRPTAVRKAYREVFDAAPRTPAPIRDRTSGSMTPRTGRLKTRRRTSASLPGRASSRQRST